MCLSHIIHQLMKYRDHRGSLKESMETTQEFTTKEQLLAHLNAEYYPKPVLDVSFRYAGYDPRIAQGTWHVIAHTADRVVYAGMSNAGSFDNKEVHGSS